MAILLSLGAIALMNPHGYRIYLDTMAMANQPNVQQMLWFRRFFQMGLDGLYELKTEPQDAMVAPNHGTADCLTETAAI